LIPRQFATANLLPVSLSLVTIFYWYQQHQRYQWQIATGVVDTGGAHSLANISANFSGKFEMTLMLLSGAWRKMIHEKT
jgi:hypothetical protein